VPGKADGAWQGRRRVARRLAPAVTAPGVTAQVKFSVAMLLLGGDGARSCGTAGTA
jgi:hypothetical protein